MQHPINSLIILVSAGIATWSFSVAYLTHKRHRTGKKGRPLPGVVIGGIFAISLTFLAEALLYRVANTSFYTLATASSLIPVGIFLSGALQGVVYEYVGSVALGQWYYPTVRHRRHLFLILPFFWALFMLIMQDTYAICRYLHLSTTSAFIITSLVPFVLIEGINVYTRSWIYQRLLRQIPLLIAGWFLMTLTFVWAFNTYVIKPFGY